MQVGFFNPVSDAGTPATTAWPVPPVLCEREAVSETMRRAKEQLCLADELGFDWVSVSEHHYSPRILAPSPMIYAGAMTEVVKRAKIAVLGPLLPLSNPGRVAEEIAMLDAMSAGRILVLFLRGTANEILTYRSNPGSASRRSALSASHKAPHKPWHRPSIRRYMRISSRRTTRVSQAQEV